MLPKHPACTLKHWIFLLHSEAEATPEDASFQEFLGDEKPPVFSGELKTGTKLFP